MMILRETIYGYDCNARHVHDHGRNHHYAHDDGYDRGHDRNKTHPPHAHGHAPHGAPAQKMMSGCRPFQMAWC